MFNLLILRTPNFWVITIYDFASKFKIRHFFILIAISIEYVKLVLEVKSTIDSGPLKEAIKELYSVKQLDNQIAAIIGFNFKLKLRTLYLQGWKSKVVQSILVLDSTICPDLDTQLFKRSN